MSFEAGALMILRERGGSSHMVLQVERFDILGVPALEVQIDTMKPDSEFLELNEYHLKKIGLRRSLHDLIRVGSFRGAGMNFSTVRTVKDLSDLLPRRVLFISDNLNHCSTANVSDGWSTRFESPTESRSDFAQLGLKAA